ncbi:MAG TPA: beta-L-arabinofuranosidase domain-containing protein [Humibacter sp.]|nr:beta-L-arabinofuranosidase domain-containing protein [Humibacter sp.]
MTIPPHVRAQGGPVQPRNSLLRPLSQAELRITGGFWGEKQTLNAGTIIEYCRLWMERIGWIGNFDRAAAGTIAAAHAGIEFVDSEVYKLLEAMAWELGREPDARLQHDFDDLVARVAAAQEPDGYLHTSFGRSGQRERYSDLEWGHELYCFGHLIQAAVARLRTGHDDLLVNIARRLADHVYLEFGPSGREAICGHPEIEPALVEFARATDDERYRELAALFILRRGHRTLATTLFQGHEYFLDDMPVRDATVLRGHAVRALYLASGAVDLAADDGDGVLLAAVQEQWRNTVARRTYLTGGMGSHHQNEEFGEDFELPPDRAYSETCAGIGSVMLSWRLLLQTGEAKYADLIERTLLNNILASPREDGRGFFYTNTLQQRTRGTEPHDDELSERAETSMRAPWFEVSCCPTNIARTLASVSSYFATTDDTGVQLHQFADLEVRTATGDGTAVRLTMRTGYPFDGDLVITVTQAAEFTLAVRIPAWAKGATARIGDDTIPVGGAYLRLRRAFQAGDTLVVRLPVTPRITTPAPQIDAVRGTVAVERGPLVLCLESTDLPEGVTTDQIALAADRGPEPTPFGARVNVQYPVASAPTGGGSVASTTVGVTDWPYGTTADDATPATTAVELHPYFSWANRGPSTMRVWIPVAGT